MRAKDIKIDSIYRYGISIQDRGFILHFGIRFFELWFIYPSKIIKLKKLFSYRIPDKNQCVYALKPRFKLVRRFFGYTTLKD